MTDLPELLCSHALFVAVRCPDGRTVAEDMGLAADEIVRLRQELAAARAEIEHVADMVDDILYDPTWHPRDEYGDEIRGNDLYLVPHPVQEDHMPALRMWFVQRAKADTAARAAGGGDD